jgi:4-hydroxy-tetrahydrodipicolinate synthase
MRTVKKLKGTGVAIVTPFHKEGGVNFNCLEKLVERLISGKVDYLVPLGTTGESVTLNSDEKVAVLDFVTEVVDGRVPVVVGIGGNNTSDVLRNLDKFDLEKVDAILSVSPYYNKPSQKGIYQHYKAIANESPAPVILYNVPSRTGSNITADTTLALANDFDQIIGVKEASGDLEQIMKIISGRPNEFLVISGDDLITLPMIACGADGVISVVANAFPGEFSDMVRAALKGQMDKARKLHYLLSEIIPLLFSQGSPGGIKAVLSMMEICEDHLRLPLVPVSKAHQNKLADALDRIYDMTG